MHDPNDKNLGISIRKTDASFLNDNVLDAHLDIFEELTGVLYATEKNDENPFLLINCCKRYRVPINVQTTIDLKPHIGSNISILKTEKKLLILLQNHDESQTRSQGDSVRASL